MILYILDKIRVAGDRRNRNIIVEDSQLFNKNYVLGVYEKIFKDIKDKIRH